MNASEFDERRIATSEFLDHGLGATLTANAQLLMRGMELSPSDEDRWLATFACAYIIERVLWQAIGIWMGYFTPIAPVNEEERAFLRDHVGHSAEFGLPESFQELGLRIGHLETGTDTSFYRETFRFIPLGRSVPEWFPVFQATLISAELLSGSAMTSFFLFLHRGDPGSFEKTNLDRDAILSYLGEREYTDAFLDDSRRPEAVIAGFIRYTEFLSAWDAIFPDVETGGSVELSDRVLDRDILRSFLTQHRWRFPDRSFERYQAVVNAFMHLTATEIARHPAMGVQWSPGETFIEIARLSRKAFLDSRDEEVFDEEDSFERDVRKMRLEALQRRIRALSEGAEGSEGTAVAIS